MGILPCMPGFLWPPVPGIYGWNLEEIFRYGWFFGFFVSGIVYLMGMGQSQLEPAGMHEGNRSSCILELLGFSSAEAQLMSTPLPRRSSWPRRRLGPALPR